MQHCFLQTFIAEDFYIFLITYAKYEYSFTAKFQSNNSVSRFCEMNFSEFYYNSREA